MAHDFKTLAELTAAHAAATPGKTAVRFEGRSQSYAELHDAVLRCVAALRAEGVAAGDRVGWLGLNHPDYVVVMNACFRIGAVLVSINARLVAREIAYILGDAGIGLLISEAQFLGVAEEARAAAGVQTIILIDAPHAGRPAFGDWIAGFAPDATAHPASPEDIALQLYTSGTTGFPKGALLSHRALLGTIAKGGMTGEAWSHWDEDDICLVAMPLFHIGGTGWALHALEAGATMVILPRPDIAGIVDAVATERITKMFAVPAVLAAILQHLEAAPADLGSLTELLYGASPIPLDILRRSMAAFPNASFIQCYGATETSGTVVYLPPEDHDVAGNARMLGCGKPFPGQCDPHPRWRGPRRADGYGRRGRDQVGQHDERLSSQPRSDRQGAGRWLVSDRRCRVRRWRWLSDPVRPGEGHDRFGGGEHLSGRGRECPARTPGRRRLRRHRRAR